MNCVDIINPAGPGIGLDAGAFCKRLDAARHETAAPFAPERMALAARVGQAILQRGRAAVPPFVTHFAFWIRSAALQRLAADFQARLPPHTQARARGLVFHLPPQNVETVFLYSWVLSYLGGNANVVRLPASLSDDMLAICGLFLENLARENDASQFFVHYPSASDISVGISACSDARLVWGGDAKVAAFAPMPLRRGGKSLWFGDRFSFCVLRGAALAALDKAGRTALAKRLYNDAFVFDQMACASPHIVYVIGDPQHHQSALNDVLDLLAAEARARGHQPVTGHAIRKMVAAFKAAAHDEASSLDWRDTQLTRVVTRGGARREERIGGGYVRVAYLSCLTALPKLVREHDQTVTHFGFTAKEIETAAQGVHGGVSRWVPVGAALDFDSVWDGYDIPFELTKLVRVSSHS